mgnify:CR=1 FL=1
METRVAVLAIIVRGGSSVQPLNELLHQYGQYIIGRMGVPYREKGVNIISVALDAPGNVISALSGKIGRLGGTTPTGYASESVRSITVDGKTKKACKLKLLPDEAEIIYKIFDLYEQYDSLTMTETELLRQGIKTKTGRSFTRFSIKSILQNPVYLIADKDAYQHFVDNEAALFSSESGKKASPPS